MQDLDALEETPRSKEVNKEYAERLKRLLKSELKKRGVSYKELAQKLQDMGLAENDRSISNKISRGSFTAVFLVECLVAIGCTSFSLDEL